MRELYDWFEINFAYFRSKETHPRWKSAIRHNL